MGLMINELRTFNHRGPLIYNNHFAFLTFTLMNWACIWASSPLIQS